MNVEHEDEEFVNVELRGSGHNKQNNDPQPRIQWYHAERVEELS